MRFTTPSIASAGKPVFAIREVFVPEAWFPSLLLFRHPSRASIPFFRMAIGVARFYFQDLAISFFFERPTHPTRLSSLLAE